MPNKKLGAAVLLLVAGLVGFAGIMLQRVQRSEAAVADLKGTVGALSRQLGDAEARVSIAPAPLAPAAVNARTAVAGPAPVAEKRPDPDANLVPEPPSAEDQRAFVQANFAMQDVDATWSRTATAEAKRMFDSLAGKDTAVRSVDCRSSLCRVELAQSNEDEARRVAAELMGSGKLGWQGAISAAVEKTNPDGSVAYVLFLARSDMPALD
jgi:hypothetical protein